MPRNLSNTAKLAINQVASSDPIVYLLTVNTYGYLGVLRLTNNLLPVTFNSVEYTPFPFQVEVVTTDLEGSIPELELQMSNAGLIVSKMIEDQDGRTSWDINLKMVLIGKDSIELLIESDYRSQQIKITEEHVSITIGAENALQYRFPPRKYLRHQFPNIPL